MAFKFGPQFLIGYLAANPDVAAAHVNPLDHFQSGIFEGRQAVNDGPFN
jgi:hypothetical protein